MNWIGGLHAGVQLVDFVIAVVVIEIAIFGWLKRWPIIVGLFPGLCLLLAVRAAWVGAGWPLAIIFLTLSLPAHLADLRLRTRRSASD